ncbi:MAG: hypothetical protein AAGB93_13880, partial [Planctomycetota bacterium]
MARGVDGLVGQVFGNQLVAYGTTAALLLGASLVYGTVQIFRGYDPHPITEAVRVSDGTFQFEIVDQKVASHLRDSEVRELKERLREDRDRYAMEARKWRVRELPALASLLDRVRGADRERLPAIHVDLIAAAVRPQTPRSSGRPI